MMGQRGLDRFSLPCRRRRYRHGDSYGGDVVFFAAAAALVMPMALVGTPLG